LRVLRRQPRIKGKVECDADNEADETGAIHKFNPKKLPREAVRRGDRVESSPAPRMATEQAAQAESDAAANAMGADRLLGVGGARGRVTTAPLEPKHDLYGRENDPVGADEKDQDMLHEPISMARFLKKATRERQCPHWTLVCLVETF
jgi:hypothetical protein